MNRYRGRYRSQIENDRYAAGHGRPPVARRIAQVASTAVNVGATVVLAGMGLRYAAQSGLLQKAGQYILAASDATNRHVARHGLKIGEYGNWGREFRTALGRIQKSTLDGINRPNPEAIRLLMNERTKILSKIDDELADSFAKGYIDDVAKAKRALEGHFDDEIIKRLSGEPSRLHKVLGVRSMTIGEAIDATRRGNRKLLTDEAIDFIEDLQRTNEKYRNIRNLRLDRAITIDGRGHLQDFGAWSEITDRTLEWWSNTMIGGIGQFHEKLADRRTPFAAILGGEGDGFHPVMRHIEDLQRMSRGEHVNWLPRKLQHKYLAVGERVVNLHDPENIVVSGMKIVHGEIGPRARMLRNFEMLDQTLHGEQPRSAAGKIAGVFGLDEFLDIGHQDSLSRWERIKGWFRKGSADDYAPKIFKQLLHEDGLTYEQYDALEKFFQKSVQGLDQTTMDILGELLPDGSILKGLDVLDRRHAMETALELTKSTDNLAQFESFKRFVQGSILPDPDGFYNRFGSGQQLQRELSELLVSNIPRDEALEHLGEALASGKINLSQYQRAVDVMTGLDFKRQTEDLSRIVREAKRNAGGSLDWMTRRFDDQQNERLRTLFHTEGDFKEGFLDLLDANASLFSSRAGVGLDPNDFQGVGSQYTVISKSRITSLDIVQELNEWTTQRGREVIGEFWAGRHNLHNVTDATLFTYKFGERISNLLSNVGLGLSSRSMSSIGGMYAGIFGKRMLAGYALYKSVSYIDYEFEKITGLSLEQRWHRAQAQTRIERAERADRSGKTERRKRAFQIRPGLDRLQHFPIIGSTFEEPRSASELIDYYMHGQQPVRKNRWWRLGSSTPYIGDRTSYYLPNEYILGTSSWLFTDTLYGDKDEYWSRSWFPTPRYPLAPLKALWDPYWLERKHYDDRPYPLTGELFEPNVPGAPLLNATIGELIKPVRPMHRDAIREYNEEVKRKGRERKRTMPTSAPVGVVADGTITPQVFMPVFPEYAGSYLAGSPMSPLYASDSEGVPSGFNVIGSPLVTGEDAEGIPFAYPQGKMIPYSGAYGGMAGDPAADGFYTVASAYPTNRVQAEGYLDLSSRDIVEQLNTAILSRSTSPFGTPITLRESPPEFEVSDFFAPNDPDYRLSSLRWSAVKLAGIYGFAYDTLTGGDPYRHTTMVASASQMYGLDRRVQDMNLGGITGDLSEVYRRFLPPRSSTIGSWNPIRNTMPTWLPGPEAFVDFLHGDPYVKVPHGELRLPGEAYEKTHTLHSDPWFGKYGALERMKILGDVAPYSDQYKAYRSTVANMLSAGLLPEEWRSKYQEIVDQVNERKQRYELMPYQFVQAFNTKRVKAKITGFIDGQTFMTDLFPDNPVRLGGLKLSKDADLRQYVYPGQTVELLVAKNFEDGLNDDRLKTVSATMFLNDENLNMQLIDSGLATETSDTDPASVWARFTPDEIRTGASWEKFSHLNIPILHKRLMSVNSPLEYYKRNLIYGKEYQSWDRPVDDFLRPTLESYMSRDPISAGFLGAFTGALVGKIFFGGGSRTRGGAIIGGAISVAGSLVTGASSLITRKTWKPHRRRKQHEIEEYFDILQYVKYRGLYEQASRLAYLKEGVNIDRILDDLQEENRAKIAQIASLEEEARRLTIQDKHYHSARIHEINQTIRELNQGQETVPLKPYTLQAIKYRAEYESTLYGLDLETANDEMIFRALPGKDRQFYEHFVKETDPKRRKEILDLIPANQRRLYQSKWGMEVDDLPNLTQYFKKHRLPDPGWIGWDPNIDLSYFKVKVAENEAIDMTALDVWETDLQVARQLGLPNLDPFKPNRLGFIRSNLERVLKGAGLRGVVVDVVESSTEGVIVDFDIIQDRNQELQQIMSSLLTGGGGLGF